MLNLFCFVFLSFCQSIRLSLLGSGFLGCHPTKRLQIFQYFAFNAFLQITVKRYIWLWSKLDQSEANMVFTIRANPSFRAVNLSIYLVFTAIVKFNVWSHLLNCVMCANMMFTFCANTIKVKKTLPLFRICYQCK